MDHRLNRENHFLSALQVVDRQALEPNLQPVELRQGSILQRFGEPITRVFFPVSAVVSIAVCMRNGDPIQCALIGRDGAVGAGGGNGVPVAGYDAIVQISGTAWQIPVENLTRLNEDLPNLRTMAARAEAVVAAQAGVSAACHAVHSAESRICRWVLEIADRTSDRRMPLTQELLAKMLGLQRTTVTLAAGRLQASGALLWRRGFVEVARRDMVVDCACSCYERIRHVTSRLLPPPSDPGKPA